MGLVKIRFEVANEVQFSRAFEFAQEKQADFTHPFELMSDDFYKSMSEVFSSEGAYEERKHWQELSPAYAAWKMRHYPGKKILERTGRLKRSLTVKGGEDSVSNITPSELAIGTRVPYAILHQMGTKRLPQRKIIELTEKQKLRWVRIAHKYMQDVNEEFGKITRGA